MDMEAEKPTLSAFERFLYWFFIPIVFATVMLGALLSLFDYDVKNQLLKFGNMVPGLSAVLPEPKSEATPQPQTKTSAQPSDADGKEAEVANLQKELDNLKAQLSAKDTELQTSQAASKQQEQTVKDLQAKIAALEEKAVQEAKSDEEYQSLVAQTASMYAKMSASKAAPIMEKLSLEEQVLLLSEMKTDDRVRILEKMDSAKAAEASILLKDVKPAKDRQIAALQERLKLNESSAKTTTASTITKAELGQTVAGMTSKDAAAMLMEMEKTTPAKVTEILNSMDATARAKIMSVVANQSKETAASITSRLAP